MGITDRVGELAGRVQTGTQTSLVSLAAFVLRLLTGIFIGLTLALIGQEVFRYGYLSLLFITVLSSVLFMRLSRAWSLPVILIFDLVTFLVALLLKMYIQLAP